MCYELTDKDKQNTGEQKPKAEGESTAQPAEQSDEPQVFEAPARAGTPVPA